ncbi:MAG: DUF1013 domain-containing protein, partial [Paracoccaceae bacterium]
SLGMTDEARNADPIDNLAAFAKVEKEEAPADFSDAESFFNLPDADEDDEDDEDDNSPLRR